MQTEYPEVLLQEATKVARCGKSAGLTNKEIIQRAKNKAKSKPFKNKNTQTHIRALTKALQN